MGRTGDPGAVGSPGKSNLLHNIAHIYFRQEKLITKESHIEPPGKSTLLHQHIGCVCDSCVFVLFKRQIPSRCDCMVVGFTTTYAISVYHH